MFKSIRPVWAEINLDNLAHNMREIKRVTKTKEIMAIIKADAYGHGAIDVAPVLLENGATSFGVAVITEALELRKSGIKAPIMILGYTPLTFAKEILKYDIEQTVFTFDYAKALSNEAEKFGKTAKIHIGLDTGMGRIGFLPSKESLEEVYAISKLPNIEIAGLFSHFSSADEEDKEYTYEQMEKFNTFYSALIERGVKINKRHIANSAAVIDLPDTHLECVRPGLILFGYYPSEEIHKDKIALKPVLTLKTDVVHVKKVEKDVYISYGRKYRTEKESVIATLPIGYADGYTRLLFNKAKVIIKGKLAPVVGRICMDQCMVDVTDIGEVNVGDEVILIGREGNVKFDADDIAELLGTINYEIVCMIGKRVPRVYIKNGNVVKVRNYM
ncbi:alanine racemase [Clostridium polynesiense]|uniref:alanine racemase n=1 Tax=Clostridium polynesiense TaxID=1325933 RepID=UPI0005916D76|nr:alanine racemase [Clostridium polynesiense]